MATERRLVIMLSRRGREWAMMRSKAAARRLVPSIAFHAAKVG
jgi:hypothetical protein